MRATTISALLAIAVAMTTASTGSLAQQFPASIEGGQLLVQKHCGGCHAISTKDLSKHREAPAFRDVLKRYSASDLEEALAEGILTGHADMPEFKFEPVDVRAIIKYLSTLSAEQ